jgi:hypothetical protein
MFSFVTWRTIQNDLHSSLCKAVQKNCFLSGNLIISVYAVSGLYDLLQAFPCLQFCRYTMFTSAQGMRDLVT